MEVSATPSPFLMEARLTELPNCTCRIVHDAMNLFNAIAIIGVLPVLAGVGVVSNVVNVHVYRRGASSAERYLMALAMSDLGVCASGILVIAADSLRAHNFYVDQLFVLLLPKLIPFGLFFQMTSIYVTVMAAVDCYIQLCRPWVCFPNKERRYCCVANANRILLGVVIGAAFYNVIQFGELEAVKCFDTADGMVLYELCPTEMRVNDVYVTVYRGYMYAFTMAFFPFAVLTILTALILLEMQRRKAEETQNADRLAPYKDFSDSPDKPENDENASVVLVLVVVLNLGCSFVSLLVNVCDMFEGALSRDTQMALIDIGNLLVVFNATANFIIYASTSCRYRELAAAFLHLSRPQSKTCTAV